MQNTYRLPFAYEIFCVNRFLFAEYDPILSWTSYLSHRYKHIYTRILEISYGDRIARHKSLLNSEYRIEMGLRNLFNTSKCHVRYEHDTLL